MKRIIVTLVLALSLVAMPCSAATTFQYPLRCTFIVGVGLVCWVAPQPCTITRAGVYCW